MNTGYLLWLIAIVMNVATIFLSVSLFKGDNGGRHPPYMIMFIPFMNLLGLVCTLDPQDKCWIGDFYVDLYKKLNTDYIAIFLPVVCVLTLFLME